MGQVLGDDTVARAPHGEEHRVTVGPGSEGDGAVRGGVPQGVRDEIAQDLAHPHQVGVEPETGLGAAAQADARGAGRAATGGHDLGDELPYDRSRRFTINGPGFLGEPLAGSFGYVIAIDDNRRTGVSPLDRTRPLGADKGGGSWLHVDHEGPTQSCVSLAKQHMRELLLTLGPEQHPVIVMGDAESLRR